MFQCLSLWMRICCFWVVFIAIWEKRGYKTFEIYHAVGNYYYYYYFYKNVCFEKEVEALP